MALVNFYRTPPAPAQVASDLNGDELVVFNSSRVGAQRLGDQVKALVDFAFNTHNENTMLKWSGLDFYLMVRSNFGYDEVKREKLRWIAMAWIRAGWPDQVRGI